MPSTTQTSSARRDRRHGRFPIWFAGLAGMAMFIGAATAALADPAQAALAPGAAAGASAPAPTDQKPPPPTGQKPPATTASNCADDTTLAAGTLRSCLGFGVAVGGFFFTEPDVVTTSLDPGTRNVRVTEEHQREASLWFEIHSTFIPVGQYIDGITNNKDFDDITFGPFAALQLGGTNGTLTSFAVGGMIFFPIRKPNEKPADLSDIVAGFGLGLGYGWTQIHRLGDGITEDQPLPAALTTVPIKQADIGGLVVMLSTTVSI